MVNDNYDVNANVRCAVPNYMVKNAQYNPRLLSDVNFRGELAQDQFEKSSGSSVGTITSTAGLGGAIGAATGFTLLGNPIEKGKDGELKVKESFWKTRDKAVYNKIVEQEINSAKNNVILKEFALTGEQYGAVEQLAKAKDLASLPEEVKNELPKNIQTPEAAKELVTKAEPKLKAINMDEIKEAAAKRFEAESAQHSNNMIKNLTTLEERVKTLKPEATAEEVKAILEENKSLLGLKDEGQLAKTLEDLGKKTPEELTTYVQKQKEIFTNRFAKQTEDVLRNVEKESGKLAENAAEGVSKMFGKFKIAQLQKYGLSGAAIGAIFGFGTLLGKSDKA